MLYSNKHDALFKYVSDLAPEGAVADDEALI